MVKYREWNELNKKTLLESEKGQISNSFHLS